MLNVIDKNLQSYLEMIFYLYSEACINNHS